MLGAAAAGVGGRASGPSAVAGSVTRMPAATASRPDSRLLTRVAGATAVVWGGALLVRGRQMWRAVDGRPPAEVDELAVVVLGLRHLAQGGVQLVAPDRFQRVFVGVDALHALSMVGLAAVDAGRRRPALVSGGAAVVTAALAVAARQRRV